MEIIIKVKRVCVVRKATVMASLALRHANPDGLFSFLFSPASVLAFAEDGTCFPAFKKVSRFGNAPRHSK